MTFDEASDDGRPPEKRADYECLADFADELPLLINHFPFLTSSGFRPVGRVINFAVIDGDPFASRAGCCASRNWTAAGSD